MQFLDVLEPKHVIYLFDVGETSLRKLCPVRGGNLVGLMSTCFQLKSSYYVPSMYMTRRVSTYTVCVAWKVLDTQDSRGMGVWKVRSG